MQPSPKDASLAIPLYFSAPFIGSSNLIPIPIRGLLHREYLLRLIGGFVGALCKELSYFPMFKASKKLKFVYFSQTQAYSSSPFMSLIMPKIIRFVYYYNEEMAERRDHVLL
jgi:hypothetical protein